MADDLAAKVLRELLGEEVTRPLWEQVVRGSTFVYYPPEAPALEDGAAYVVRVAWLGDSLAAGLGCDDVTDTPAHLTARQQGRCRRRCGGATRPRHLGGLAAGQPGREGRSS